MKNQNGKYFSREREWDANPDEHEFSMYLRDGYWKFDLDGHWQDYQDALGKEEADAREQRWATFYPSLPGSENETDTSFIFGRWEFDADESLKLLEQMKASRKEIEETANHKSLYYEISPTTYRTGGAKPGQSWENVFVGCERRGNKVSIKFKSPFRDIVHSTEFFYQNGLLMNLHGLVLRRVD